VQWDQGNGGEASWTDIAGVLTQNIDLAFIQTTGVSSSNSYRFRVRAKNKHDWGEFSDVVSILAAIPPDTPLSVTTTQNGLFSQI